MRFIILVAVALIAVAVAAPPEPAKIIRSEYEQQPEGSYVYSFESDDGITRLETGELKETFDEEKKPHTVITVRGSYSYIDSDGKNQAITYFADENGYHAEGDSIPKALNSRR